MEHFTIDNGRKIPAVGLGTNTIARPGGDAQALVSALKMGYRCLDSAISYNNEAGIGQIIEQTAIARSDLFIVTKIGCRPGLTDSREMIIERVNQSLRNFRTSYIDLYLIHFPGDNPANTLLTWETLADLMRQGKIHSIGVSNFQVVHLDLLQQKSRIKPVVNQVQSNPGNWNKEIIEHCRKINILPMAYSPLSQMTVVYTSVLDEIGRQYGKTWAQIQLRFNYQKGICSIPKSHDPVHQAENLAIFDFALTDWDIAEIERQQHS